MIRLGVRLWNANAQDLEDGWAEVERSDVDEVAVRLFGRDGEDLGTIYPSRFEAGALAAAIEAEARPRAWSRRR